MLLVLVLVAFSVLLLQEALLLTVNNLQSTARTPPLEVLEAQDMEVVTKVPLRVLVAALARGRQQ
jgi:hypothetical protein